MKLYRERPLKDFEFWSGAADVVAHLTEEELDALEAILAEAYPEGIDETGLNDIFWFEGDAIAGWLGYENFDAIMNRDEDDE